MASCVQCSLTISAALVPSRIQQVGGQSLSLSQSSTSNGLCARHAKSATLSQVASRKVTVAAQETDVAVDGAVAASSDVEIQDPSAFMADVAGLIKLVDSRDIVELEMKHANYEILIRKKEAVDAAQAPAPAPQGYQTFPGPHVMAHTAFPYNTAMAPPPAAPAPPPPAPVAAPPPPPPAKKSAGAGLPPMLSPMAGTFYRSPAPGESSFIKVGDRITKGQVVCIIEAMKLMNEIEADQSGIVVDILAEDGKSVSIETPLLVIQP